MSSQGPYLNGTPASIVFAANNTKGTPLPTGYKFTQASLRDGSDWIALKKQTLILNEDKTKNFKDPWFVHGNDYRLQFLEGRYKNGVAPACAGCDGQAFPGAVPFQ